MNTIVKTITAGQIQSFFLVIICMISTTLSPTVQAAEQSKQTRISSNGHFEVTAESYLKPIRLGRMHAWTATIHTTDGKPVTDATIKVGGGMPIHNHGFPTQPEMTKQLEPGTYLIEGFKFSMSGPWIILLDITSGDTTDSVAFDVNL